MQSHAPGDRPAPPLQGRTNKTAVLDPAPTDPSWPVPAADRVNVRESLFAAAFNGLLQQNLPTRDSCTATNIASFDHLVGALLEQRRHVQAERFGGLEVDRQHILGR